MISIIIPVYNIENYISSCIESVLAQTYDDYEVIIIDDGSSDKSPGICDHYAERDERISVIHKQNEGLSAARNDGIKMAKGQYVAFLDGDDYWDDRDALGKLASRAEQSTADIINYSYKKVYDGSENVKEYFHNIPNMPLEYCDLNDQVSFMLKYNLYIASACNKLVKRSLLTEELLFEKGLLSEDIDWCARLLAKTGSLDFICENFYCYRQRGRSITHSVSNKTCDDLTENLIRCFALRDKITEDKMKLFDSYLAYLFATFFVDQALTLDEQKTNINRLSAFSWILSKGRNIKVKVLNTGCRLFGYQRLCSIIRKAYSRKRVNMENA